jgi:glycerol-3-phosphate O-acyltransferase
MDKNSKFKQRLRRFYKNYADALQIPEEPLPDYMQLFDEQALLQIDHPYSFSSYHRKIRSPIDYYQLGLDILRPLIDFSHSYVEGIPSLHRISEQLQRGENVIWLANHQTETDPQIISLLLEKVVPHLADQPIYVAGERVITDPLAIPFSMGVDLLCIYSKRYIDHPPELKAQKLVHNTNTMQQLRELLGQGGKIIYVAPSGGRDRKNAEGVIEVAPFDPNSVEMMALMAKKAGRPTHFYPLALSTYQLFPPPQGIQTELGEERIVHYGPVRMALGAELNMEKLPGSEESDKQIRRQSRALAIWKIVHDLHEHLIKHF